MTAEQQRVINILAPLAVKYGAMHNVCSSLTISQAILETGWLKSCIGGFACFGVKGQGLVTTTQEYINGKWITIQDSFEIYKSYEDSFKGYYAFLERNPRYKRYGVIGEWDYEKACKNIFRAGYATGKDYDLSLINIIKQFKLYEYDKQALELREKLYKNINNTTPLSSPTPKPITPQPAQPIQPSQIINKKITIANGQWNVRQQPNANASVVKIVNAGQTFTSSKIENGWYYINELKGYINLKGISKAEDIKTTPSFITYKIKVGDSWWKIAQEQMGNGARCEELAKYNGMTTKTVIQPNQQIKIPK